MNCYFITHAPKDGAIAIPGEEFSIFEATCPEDKLAEGHALIQAWEVQRNDFWECVATSDSGIDSRCADRSTLPIRFEDLVFDGSRFTGVYIADAQVILSFVDKTKQSLERITSEKWVGGWGDITEGYALWLSEKTNPLTIFC